MILTGEGKSDKGSIQWSLHQTHNNSTCAQLYKQLLFGKLPS